MNPDMSFAEYAAMERMFADNHFNRLRQREFMLEQQREFMRILLEDQKHNEQQQIDWKREGF